MLSSRRTTAYLAPPWLVLLALLPPLASTSPAKPATGSVGVGEAACLVHSTVAGLEADCSSRGLDHVPQDLPPSIVSLDLHDNDLQELDNSSLSRYTELRRLDLCYNLRLGHIHPDAYQSLPLLTDLSYRGMQSLSFETMFRSLEGLKGRTVSSVDLAAAAIFFREGGSPESQLVGESVTKLLADLCILHFSLAENQMIYFDVTPLFHSRFGDCIVSLDLSNNDLKGGAVFLLKLSKLPHLEYLNVMPKSTKGATSGIVDPLDESVTHISESVMKLSFDLPVKFSRLYLGNIGRNAAPSINFSAPGLRILTIAGSFLINFTHPWRGLENLEELDLSRIDMSVTAPEFFDTFPGLRFLNMSEVFLKRRFVVNWGQRLLQNLTRLQDVDLSKNELSQLAEPMFPALLRRLYLSYNRFSAVPLDMGRLPQLQLLDLSFNAIVFLDQTQTAALDGLVSQGRSLTLRLYGNPLACDCSALAFLLWLNTTAVHVDRVAQLPCLTEAKTYSIIDHVLAQTHIELWRPCAGRLWLVVSGVGLLVLVLVLALVWLGAKFRSQIQHWVLRLLGVGGAGAGRGHFRYDAYVAHSDHEADIRLAYQLLRRRLEERGGVRLFLRERELHPAVLPGAVRSLSIVEGMHCCWRTLVLLTPHFLQDEWCDFTAQVALRTLDWRTPGRVLLLLAAPISMADIPQALLGAVEEEDIFAVWDREEDHPVWDRLVDRLLGRHVPLRP